MCSIHRRSIVLVTLLALGAAACGDSSGDGEKRSATTAVQATTVETTATPARTDTRLLEGTYRTAELTREQLIATGAAAGFAAADTEAGMEGIKRSAIVTITLAGGSWTLLLGLDGGADEVGWKGSYEVVDEDTVIATDSCGSITYHYSMQAGQLELRVVDDQCPGVGELVAQTIWYQTAPFGKVAVEPADAEVPATPAVASGHSSTYDTNTFVLPFEVTVPGWLPAAPSVDSPNFVTWETTSPADPKVRFLVPVNVYPPGGTGTTPPPQDYLTYLLSQSAHGASFADRTETTVGGWPATLVTATVLDSLDGSLGCQAQSLAAPDCFGLQPDLTARIAVIDAGHTTLLAWLRHARSGTGDTTKEFASFEQMLASVRFLDQSAQATTATTEATTVTPIDGVWTTSFTHDELAQSPLLYDASELNDENWGQLIFTFEHGRFTSTQTNPKATSSGSGTVRVDGDTVSLTLDNGEHFVMRWSLQGDQHSFARDESLGIAPTPIVLKPWNRQP